MSEPTAVLIESIIKRPGGSSIPMGDMTYHFRPDDAGRHVAIVSNPDHISRFLQITEGFLLLSTAPVTPAPAPAVPVGITAAPVTPQEPQAPQAPVEPPAIPHPAAPVAAPAVTVAEQHGDAPQKPLDQMTDEEIRAVFKAELGRIAPPKSKIETMIAQIEAIRAERAAAQ